MVDLEKVRYPCITDRQTHTPNTNTVVALAQAETEVKFGLQVGARLTEKLSCGWVGGGSSQETIPLRGSILQAGTCQILSLAENPRWSRE